MTTKRLGILASLVLALLIAFPHWATGQEPADTGLETGLETGLYVDAAQDWGAISPYSYGTNHGPWAVVPFELLSAAETAGITYLRFPGGEWGDRNDIRENQIDEFIRLAKLMGAEPSISVRLQNGTPEAAVELLRYTNIEKEYGVRYWSIGNEPNLYVTNDKDFLNPENTEYWNSLWRDIAEAMLEVDPSIILIGPDTNQYPPHSSQSPNDVTVRAWLLEFLKMNGDLIDIVAVHRYPFPRLITESTPIDDLRDDAAEWDIMLDDLRSAIRETLGRDMPIGVMEFNSHWGPPYGGEATPDSHFSAIWLADVLGRMIRQKVDIIAHFTLQMPNQYGGQGLLGSFDDIRPSYYVYQIYQRFGTTLLQASSAEPYVSIYAAQRDDGTLTLIVVNLSDDEKTLPLQIDNFISDGDAEMWLFDSEHNAELMGTQSLAETVTLPPQSVTLYAIPATAN